MSILLSQSILIRSLSHVTNLSLLDTVINGDRCNNSVTYSHHLNPWFWGGGFLLNGSTEPSIYKLSSRAPRFFCPDTGVFSYYPTVRIRTVYAVNILLASSRILIAALWSLSISFPHSQWYTLSDNFSPFFILPHLQHFLLEGKKRSTFTIFFPCHASLYSCLLYTSDAADD